MTRNVRVVVVGGGCAGLCAALSAREHGADVLVLERAPIVEAGGNSAFTSGAVRVAYDSADDLIDLLDNVPQDQLAATDFGQYPAATFADDIRKATGHRSDPALAALLVGESLDTLRWMRRHGVLFQPIYGRQSVLVDGKHRFFGGLAIEFAGGGRGLVATLTRAVQDAGVAMRYGTRAVGLETAGHRVVGVRVDDRRSQESLAADAVVLACGGFEANAEWRARYLGPGWDLAKVRGTRFNTGDGLRMAIDAGAMPWGEWSGAHAVGLDFAAPPFGDLAVGELYQRYSYPFSIMVNALGLRFVDEGADFRNYTYVKYGRELLRQPGQMAWQVYDAKVIPLLREEYRIPQVTMVRADSLEELADRLEGVDTAAFLRTIHTYNAAVLHDRKFDRSVKDGRRTAGLSPDKTNWAQTIDQPPFEAYRVTCGITFTFGGLRVTPAAEVLDEEEIVLAGLYACGEIVGGLFYGSYPGGSGLTSAAVFGRIAGRSATGARG